MFLYILLFLNSCLSKPSRKISSITTDDQCWYIGFDEQLEPADSFWSPKLYYSPALDNLRKFGSYTHKEKNKLRNYLRDTFDKDGNSLYPTLEKLLLVLFPSPSGSLSITSSSDNNLNTFISRLSISNSEYSENTSKIEKKLLTKEFALAKTLNIVYKILSLSKNEINKATKNNSIKELITLLQDEFRTYYNTNIEKWKSNNNTIKLNINSMINKILNPLIDFVQQTTINPEEKGLIQHAFMKWSLMHTGTTDIKSISLLINQLSFFKKNSNEHFSNNSEKLFQQTKTGFSHLENIYLTNFPFENGIAYAFNQNNQKTKEIFPDCTETTIRHFFNYVLKKNGKFQILEKFHPKLKGYYKGADDLKVLGTDVDSRTTWNEVVSYIPGAQYNKDGNDLKSNISNILYVIEYLITNEEKKFQELTTDDMVQKKFNNIKNLLHEIKSIELDSSNDNYILNNFFIINTNYNHSFVTLKNNNIRKKNKKDKTTSINPENLNILESSFLINFFTFNFSKKTMPLFQSPINDITTIFNFFNHSNELDEDSLNDFSAYIGRVLSSALWEDINIASKIYEDKNLVNLINKIKSSENIFKILQGVQVLRLMFNQNGSMDNPLELILKENFSLLKKVRSVETNFFPLEKINDLKKIITNNALSLRKFTMINQSNNIDDILALIFSCVHLNRLEIRHSFFNKPLSVELGELNELNELNLSSNKLTGFIPKELGKLIKLEFLYLHSNQLEGSIPIELGKLINLKSLDLSLNQLEESIPIELENLTKLDFLQLSSNKLSGSIPNALGKLINLNILELYENNLSGAIPKNLKNLTKLWKLDLSSNLLEGFIPVELGNLTELKFLSLKSNKLTGSIPKELEKLTNLWELNLKSNQLSGNIPKNLEKHKETINPQIKITGEYNLLLD